MGRAKVCAETEGIMRKKMTSAISAILIMTMCISGCGNKTGNSNETKQDNSTSQTQDKTEGTKKQDSEKPAEKLTILTVPASAPFPDNATVNSNEFIDLIKEVTGYDLDWQLFKTGEETGTQLNLLMASGSAPDLIQIAASPELVYQYASQGGLAELNEAYEAKGGYLKEIYTEDTLDAASYNGKLYALPRYSGGAPIGTWAVRQDWLDELGLAAPVTRDDLYHVLKEFQSAYPSATPLIVNTLYQMIPIMGSFGIYTSGSVDFLIEDGKAVMPMLTERGKEFIQYMNKLYSEELIDPEFLTNDTPIEKMIAGQGGMMFLNNVEIARNMASFKEKNPDGELVYIDSTTGDHGEQGYLSQNLFSLYWIVPKTSQAKAESCVDFLNRCNESKEIVDTISLGFEGQSYTKDGDDYVKTEKASDYVYKGYYSRVIVSRAFDDWNSKMEGYESYMNQADQYKHMNDILYAPMGVPESSDLIPIIKQNVSDAVLSMIIDGYSDEAFDAMKAKFTEDGGDKIMEEYQNWYDNNK